MIVYRAIENLCALGVETRYLIEAIKLSICFVRLKIILHIKKFYKNAILNVLSFLLNRYRFQDKSSEFQTILRFYG